jgi:outer membrane receptor for ferrienterochelin and colicin
VTVTAWAQSSTTGVIEGRVRDQEGNAVVGATVTGLANRSPSAAVTDAHGRYTLANLPPGIYKVRAEAPDKAAMVLDGIVVSIGTRSRVDITLVAEQTETVTVTARNPVVDTKTVTTGGTFKVEKFIDQLPVGRNLAATLTLAPGVASGGGTGAGNYSISGSSGLENSYIVDGVNITSSGYGGIGTYNRVYGSLGTGVTYDFLEEVQVKTGGIDVEYGQATGGVVNTVVKTGTNDVSGSVGLYAGSVTDEFSQASLFVGAVNKQKGSWNDSAQYDLGLSIGGPIVKDKLFYFLAYNPVMTKTSATIQKIPLPRDTIGGPIEFRPTAEYPAAVAGIQTRKRTSDNYAAKLTWYASPNHRLELTAFGDPSSGDMGPQSFQLRNIDFPQGGGDSSIEYGANNYSLKYDAVFTPTFFMQAQLGYHDGQFNETSAINASAYTDQRQLRCYLSPAFCNPTQSRDNAATWANGGVGFQSNSLDRNAQAKFVLTWVSGNNELKGGAEFDRIEYSDAMEFTGSDVPVKFTNNVTNECENDPSVDCTNSGDQDCVAAGVGGRCNDNANALEFPCASNGSTTTACYDLLNTRGGVYAFLNQEATTDDLVFQLAAGWVSPTPDPTKTEDLGIFLQDTLAFAENWTLKAGVRASQQKIKGAGEYTLQYYYDDPQKTPSRTGTQALVAGEYTFDWAFAPRIGLTWDVTGDGRSKAYLNAARYYERVPNDLAVRSLSSEASIASVQWNDWSLANGGPTTTSQLSGGNVIGAQSAVLDGTKLPYVDEYVVGWQQELGRDVSYEIRGIYREQGRSLEDVQFSTVEATENYYAYYYLGTPGAPGGIDHIPFPYDATRCTYEPSPVNRCVANPNGDTAGASFATYALSNPGENTPAGFPTALRKYYALELILNKRFGNHWLFYGNMRLARLRGNYEGLFRNDNGQSDPNISSLFDFPDSPLLAGQFDQGPLNNDVPFALKMYGSYALDNGLTFGAALNVTAGIPRTPLLAHPNGFYGGPGELPGTNPIYYWYTQTDCALAPTGGYCFTKGSADAFFVDPGAFTGGNWSFPHLYTYNNVGRGYLGRAATTAGLDLSVSFTHQFNRWATFSLGATVFNVFNSRAITASDDNVELQAGATDPDYLSPTAFQDPRSIRAFARWSF